MDGIGHLVARADACQSGNEYDGRMGVRVSSIFVILFGSFLGTWFPVYAARHRGVGVPPWAFFIAKYFGSGVIVATAFIHLLAPAVDALTDPCLTGPITEYDWAEGICLMSIFVLFFVELMTMRFARFGHSHGEDEEHGHLHGLVDTHNPVADVDDPVNPKAAHEYSDSDVAMEGMPSSSRRLSSCPGGPHMPGDNHLSHSRSHPSINEENITPAWSNKQQDASEKAKTFDPESYSAQLTAVFILEFGVIFHSVFIGLTLAVTGQGFDTLYVVLAFHQTFEGLALGSRLASIDWPKSKRRTPYWLGAGYAISTPISIAIGLGVRQSFGPTSSTTLLVNGVFDSISAGILIYTGLVELMAHEFMFSGYMQRAPLKEVLAAFVTMCMGAGLMALLGKWA